LPRRRMAFSNVIYTSGVFFLTVAFALIAVVALTLRFAGGPRVLKVAVGPADGDNAKLIEAIARHLERDDGRIRFVVLPVDDLAQSAKALEQGRADLAVIRTYSAERRVCHHFAQRHCRARRAGRLHNR
jgi:hypothetical protein